MLQPEFLSQPITGGIGHAPQPGIHCLLLLALRCLRCTFPDIFSGLSRRICLCQCLVHRLLLRLPGILGRLLLPFILLCVLRLILRIQLRAALCLPRMRRLIRGLRTW